VNLKERFDQLEDRERRLIGVLCAVFAAFVLLAIPVGLAAVLGSKRSDNEQLRQAILAIGDNRDAIRKADQQREAVLARYAQPAPPLAGFLAGLAKRNGIEIPESQDRDIIPRGKKYEERTTKIVLRRVGMLSLVRFMEQVEQSPHPVRIGRLNIRKRGAEADSFDVEMLVSAFDRKASESPGGENAEETPAAEESQ
jgi:general secretion pathway protein M